MKPTFTRPSFIIAILLLLLLSTSAISQTTIAPPPPEESFSVSLYFTGPDSVRNFIDYTKTIYDNNYSTEVNGDDEYDEPGSAENIAIARDGFHLTVERRPNIEITDSIFLFMEQMNEQNYELEFTATYFSDPTLIATLIDNYTGNHILLSVIGTTVLPFAVNADPASSAPDRFMIVFAPPSTLAISGLTISGFQRTTAIEVDWLARTEAGMDHYELERSANGFTFCKLASVMASGNNVGLVKYNWLDKEPVKGNNFYRIRAVDRDGSVRYSSIVKMNLSPGGSAISVYPNPVTGNDFRLQLNGLPKGSYVISIINNSGQRLFTDKFNHGGGSSNQVIALKNNLPPGIYRLQVSSDGVKLETGMIKLRN